MSSHNCDSAGPLDLERDVPTTAEDVASLRNLRREVPSWFSLTVAEFEALVPPGALDQRPVTRPDARPFTLSSAAPGSTAKGTELPDRVVDDSAVHDRQH
jgi:hypothetical protein